MSRQRPSFFSWKELIAILVIGVYLWLRLGSRFHQSQGLQVSIDRIIGGIFGALWIAFLIVLFCKLLYRGFVWIFRKIRPVV
jgi:hypothetical protein